MAGTGYYENADVAFDSLKTFKPFTRLNIGNEGELPFDFTAFNVGFQKAQGLRIRLMKMKARAEAELNETLVELTKGEVSEAKHYTELEGFVGKFHKIT